MKLKHIVKPLEIKALSEDGSFEGYGSVFDVVDSYRDVVMPGAFSQTLEEHEEKGSMPALLWQHRSDEPIGVWTSMEEDETGLKMCGQLAIDTNVPKADEAYALLSMGAIKGLSIGYSMYPGGARWNDDDRVLELNNIKLWETSIVTFPANPEANVTDVRSALEAGELPTIREFEAFLREDAGFSAKRAKIIIEKGFKAITRDADDNEQSERDASAAILETLNSNINTLRG